MSEISACIYFNAAFRRGVIGYRGNRIGRLESGNIMKHRRVLSALECERWRGEGFF
jgi:hypothetical protein